MNGVKSYRSFSLDFKREVVRAHASGESMYSLAKRHDLSRNLIRTWVAKADAGDLKQGGRAASSNEQGPVSLFVSPPALTMGLASSAAYEARIAELERMIGRQALEIEILREALKRATEGQRGRPGRKPA